MSTHTFRAVVTNPADLVVTLAVQVGAWPTDWPVISTHWLLGPRPVAFRIDAEAITDVPAKIMRGLIADLGPVEVLAAVYSTDPHHAEATQTAPRDVAATTRAGRGRAVGADRRRPRLDPGQPADRDRVDLAANPITAQAVDS